MWNSHWLAKNTCGKAQWFHMLFCVPTVKLEWLGCLVRGDLKCHLAFAAADEEAFEDNSEEYIRRDLEGSGMFIFNCWSLRSQC